MSHSKTFALLALTCAAFCVLSVSVLHAAGPTNAAVEMIFSEGTGTTTTNSGFLAGTAILSPGTTTNGFPRFTNNVPTGAYVPSSNTYALNMGIVDTTGGGRTVDLTTDNGPFGGTLGNFVGGLTVCGWLNSRDNGVGSGGNRIAFALETPGGLGFDVMQKASGTLGFNVNQYNDGGPVSTSQITQDSNAGVSNWVFFAVTYNPGLPSGQVKFYFGRPNKLAGLDVARTYFGGPTNQIEFTGKLTVGNFNSVEPAYSTTGTGSRTYRGLIDQLRIYTNILTIDEIQQAQLESTTVPAVPATILRQPTNVTVTAGPYRTATFTLDAHGSGLLTYQWRTNGVAMPNATNTYITLPADTAAYNGTVLSVLVDNSLTSDPGILSSNAILNIIQPPTPGGVIYPSADVVYNGTQVWNAYVQQVPQINWGLGGFNGVAAAAGIRSYMMFTLGTTPVASAKLKLWMYWGGPPVNGQGRLPQSTTRIYGTLTNAPLQITEPPPGTHAILAGFDPLDNTNFFAIAPDQLVGPEIGWYEWDITSWYNACLGQTTTLLLRGASISGFDGALYEDREGTALTSGAGGTITNGSPRIELFLPVLVPRFASIAAANGQIIMNGSNGPPSGNYVLLRSTNVTLPVGSWTRVLTNQFDSAGNFSVTNAITPGASQGYYRLQLP